MLNLKLKSKSVFILGFLLALIGCAQPDQTEGTTQSNHSSNTTAPSTPTGPTGPQITQPVTVTTPQPPVTNPTISNPTIGSAVVAYNTVFRFYKGDVHDHFYTLSALEGIRAGYALEDQFLLLAQPRSGAHPLYRCYDGTVGKHFVSIDIACEGKTFEGVLGMAADAQEASTRYADRWYYPDGDHFLAIGSDTEANLAHYSREGRLGYVW